LIFLKKLLSLPLSYKATARAAAARLTAKERAELQASYALLQAGGHTLPSSVGGAGEELAAKLTDRRRKQADAIMPPSSTGGRT
jgi:hypothetical protein